MGKLLKQFNKYFNSCTEKQKKQDWKELKEYNNYGPIIKLED